MSTVPGEILKLRPAYHVLQKGIVMGCTGVVQSRIVYLVLAGRG